MKMSRNGHLALLFYCGVVLVFVTGDPVKYNNNKNDLNHILKGDHGNDADIASLLPLQKTSNNILTSAASSLTPTLDISKLRRKNTTNTVKYQHLPVNQNNFLKGQEYTCGSKEIKNGIKSFEKLENCTVIEGSLTIMLMDWANAADFAGLSFPNLIEITEYLLIYRVQGLQSLGRLFPNLAVIRGHKLFGDYSLIVFDVASLVKLDLRNLTAIERGAVRIEKNPSLCFTDTIDWNLIAPPAKGVASTRNHVIRGNKQSCGVCHSSCSRGTPTGIISSQHHTRNLQSSSPNTIWSKPTELSPLCWGSEETDCQRVCSPSCGTHSCSIYDPSVCCDPLCIGGCYSTGPSHCLACKNIKHKGVCHKECGGKRQGQVKLLEYKDRRCIEDAECLRLTYPDPKDANKSISFKSQGTDGKCLAECPSGRKVKAGDPSVCEKCENDRCPKHCPPGEIHNAQQAQEFKGCNVILGNLHIEVRQSDILTELEQSLKDLEEIRGSLRVSRSHPLVSLHFFKKLRYIGGETLEMGKYSLSVYDNPNLKELFAWNETRKLHINRGGIFFHLNPYLCVSKIKDLQIYGNVREWDERDVSNSTNGEKATCDVVEITLVLDEAPLSTGNDKNDSTAVDGPVKPPARLQLKWNNVRDQFHDKRNLISYKIYYRKARTNVTKYDGRDACRSTEWRDFDFAMDPPIEDAELNFFCPVALEPFTRYAFYVSTYTVSRAERGGESQIEYYTTPPTKPSEPKIEVLTATSENEVSVQWSKPRYPNGIIAYYKITVQEIRLEAEEGVDYCRHKIENTASQTSSAQVASEGKRKLDDSPLPEKYQKPGQPLTEDDQCCLQCKQNKVVAEEDRGDFISFENYIMNHAFQENTNTNLPGYGLLGDSTNRTKRSVSGLVGQQTLDVLPSTASSNDDFLRESSDILTSALSDLNKTSTEPNVLLSNSTEGNDNSTEPSNSTPTETPVRKMHSSTPRLPAPNRVFIINATSDDIYSFTIRNLTHYSLYKIKVSACQAKSKYGVPCSEAYQFVQTPPNPRADHVSDLKIDRPASIISLGASSINETIDESFNELLVKFAEPENPNAVIVSFKIEYAPVGKSGQGTYTTCIPYNDYMTNHQSIRLSDVPPGTYRLRVKANSLAGLTDSDDLPYEEFTVSDPKAMSTWITVVIVLCVGVFFVAVVALGSVYYVRKQRELYPRNLEYVTMNTEYMPAYEPDEWEVERDCIKIIEKLGHGSFGRVFLADVKLVKGDSTETKCAVKMVNDQATPHERLQFLKEATIMKSFKCHHVVQLLGVSSTVNPVLVVMELLPLGDLKNYLRQCRDDFDGDGQKYPKPTKPQVHLMASQILDGMSYLAARKFAHRDLACRNLFLAEDKTVKVGDFGMTRDIYDTDYYRKGDKGMLPVRWMAPESIKDGIYTSQSDVFSFGVVLWEICTLAEQPYQGLTNDQVYRFVKGGGCLEKPQDCPEDLFSIMKLCWNWNPKMRPTFPELIEYIYPAVLESEKDHFERTSYHFTLKKLELEEQERMNSTSVTFADGFEESMPLNPLVSRLNSSGSGTVNTEGTAETTLTNKRNSDSEPNSKEYQFKFQNIAASLKGLLSRGRNNSSSNNSSRDGSKAATVDNSSSRDNSKETVIAVQSSITSSTTNNGLSSTVASRIVGTTSPTLTPCDLNSSRGNYSSRSTVLVPATRYSVVSTNPQHNRYDDNMIITPTTRRNGNSRFGLRNYPTLETETLLSTSAASAASEFDDGSRSEGTTEEATTEDDDTMMLSFGHHAQDRLLTDDDRLMDDDRHLLHHNRVIGSPVVDLKKGDLNQHSSSKTNIMNGLKSDHDSMKGSMTSVEQEEECDQLKKKSALDGEEGSGDGLANGINLSSNVISQSKHKSSMC